MSDFTTNWLWPQWAIIAWLFIVWLVAVSMHGKPMLKRSFEDKGQPEKHNAFQTATRAVLMIAILICGGFFK